MVYRYTGCTGGRAGAQSQAAVFRPRQQVSVHPHLVGARTLAVRFSKPLDPAFWLAGFWSAHRWTYRGRATGPGAFAVTRSILSRTKPNIVAGGGDALTGT